jgi:O-antigen/teichoic acid export membrane protein
MVSRDAAAGLSRLYAHEQIGAAKTMSFLRFFLFNLFGNVLPILAALVSVPVIAHHAGGERLGALGVVWGLIGYFGFLDFGLSRVVTRRVALAKEQARLPDELAELRGFFWWWAMPALLVITIVLLGARAVFPGMLPSGWLGKEVADGWMWIALCIPVTLMTNWLRGALEGVQRFARLNLLKTIFGVWNYAAPALAVLVSPTLEAMIEAIFVGRLLGLLGHALAAVHAEPGILIGSAPRRLSSPGLFFREGGWMTVSNLIGPLMIYSDRFVLAALLTPTAVFYYVTSQEVMLRTLVIPAALSGVLFPKFSGAIEPVAGSEIFNLYHRSVRFISALMLPLCVLAAALAYDALRVWLGDEFAAHAHRVVELIAVGIFVTSIGQLPLAWLQGSGRSYLTARLHLVELPLYGVGLYFAVEYFGILGAACMWTLRVAADSLAMLVLATVDKGRMAISIAWKGAALILLTALLSGPGQPWQWRAALTLGACLAALLASWYGLLDGTDRKEIGKLRHAY